MAFLIRFARFASRLKQYALLDVIAVLWANLLQVLLRRLLLCPQLEVPTGANGEQALTLIVLKELVSHHGGLAHELRWWIILVCTTSLG